MQNECMVQSRPQVVAHRGASAAKAEHTLAAYVAALDDGADAEPEEDATLDPRDCSPRSVCLSSRGTHLSRLEKPQQLFDRRTRIVITIDCVLR